GLERHGQMAVGAVLEAAEDLGVHVGHALGRAQEAVSIGVLPDGLDDLADGLLDAARVDAVCVGRLAHAGLGPGRGLGTVRATRRRAGVRAGADTLPFRDGRLPTGPRTAMTSGVSRVAFSTRAVSNLSRTLRISVMLA